MKKVRLGECGTEREREGEREGKRKGGPEGRKEEQRKRGKSNCCETCSVHFTFKKKKKASYPGEKSFNREKAFSPPFSLL